MIKQTVRIYAGSRKDPISGKRIPNKKWVTIEAKNKTEFKRKLEDEQRAFREQVGNIKYLKTMSDIIDWYYKSKKHSPKTLAND